MVRVAEEAATRLSLDLAAIDVIVEGERAYVLEANTAPGIAREGTARKLAALLVRLCE